MIYPSDANRRENEGCGTLQRNAFSMDAEHYSFDMMN